MPSASTDATEPVAPSTNISRPRDLRGRHSRQAWAGAFLDELARTLELYISEVSALPVDLWTARRANSALLAQPSEQWKPVKGVINSVPVFRGFPAVPGPAAPVTSLGLGVGADLWLKAAAITAAVANDVRADPEIWT